MKRRALLLAVVLACAPVVAHAAPIWSDNFEDGDANGWAPSGGDVRLTQYAGNTSMRLSRRAAAVAAVSTRGFTGVTIAAALAANDLETGEYCLVEASADDGRTWTPIVRVDDDADDGVTLHAGAAHDAHFDNAEHVLIGARVVGNQDDDQCWLDNVRVAGESIAASAPRSRLTRDFLVGRAALADIAPMAEFASLEGAPPHNTFRGALSFNGAMTGFHLLRDSFHSGRDPALRLRTLPHIAVSLVQSGARLIPAQRGPIPGGHPYWDFAFEEGRVWDEPADGGMSRAALPFALIETDANCTHNGVLTFLFDDAGHISRVAWQIASETCAYLQYDAWGVADATYQQGIANADALITAATAEAAQRIPTRPLSQLAVDHPGVDLSAFASPADIAPAALTTFGVIANGVHYLGGCDTRAGPYPFCEAIDLPSYSLAKTLVAGLGLMRLEQLYPGAMNEPIAAHVPQCADWAGVSFENALDMATGRYRSPEDQADENAMTGDRFFLATTHAEKIRRACTGFPRREAPGARWVYHTTDTYVLGAAMQDFWRARRGANADFFNDVLVPGIYAPLHLSPTIAGTRRTADAVRQPYTGWGLTLQRDDIAKLGVYLAARDHPSDLVAEGPLNAAMQRDPGNAGLQAGAATLRYNNGFWAYNAQTALHCADPVWVPFLSGFGGIIVALMPNGVVYYYVSDGGDFAWARAVRAANAIAPMCTRPAP
jgi:hypothetical protein